MGYKYKRSADFLLDTIFPRKCVCCDEIIDGEEELCDNCIRFIERVDTLKRCLACGIEKPNCDCKYNVYHFAGLVAPFFNEGLAQNGMYDFKLNSKTHYSIFFSREMARCVVNEFKGINFDAVCYVPISKLSYLKRGFNQSLILAKGVSEILGLPLIKNSLFTKFYFGSQHKSNRARRFERVRKIFYFNKKVIRNIRNKTILLVDDIKTTGATLDECARQLLLLGAKEVYCVTALVTNRYKNETKVKPPMTEEKAEKILSKFGNNIS